MTVPKIKILDDSDVTFVVGEIEVSDAYIYERINDKYTFDFTCYKQKDTHLIAQGTIIFADEDYFRIATVKEYPVQGRYEVSCEHISYELNEDYDELENAVYVGTAMEIANEILIDNNTRFRCTFSDATETYTFITSTGPLRSRLIEFAKTIGFELMFHKFEMSILKRRGHDFGLEISLGENLKDLTISKTFNFDKTITTSYDIDFIDLNKVYDKRGNPLKPYEFHMGDTVYLKIDDRRSVSQRGVAVGYNPFRQELPTIELESPVRDITEVIASSFISAPTTEPKAIYWLGELKIGDVNCLNLNGIQIPSATTDLIKAKIEYTNVLEYTGLFATLKEAYQDFTIKIFENGVEYTETDFSNMGTYQYPKIEGSTILIEISKGTAHQYFGVKFVVKEIPPQSSDDRYTLEFGTAPVSSNTQFIFTDSYDSVESVTLGLVGSGSPPYMNLIADPLQNPTTGKYIGLSIKASPVVAGKEVSVQAVCFKEKSEVV